MFSYQVDIYEKQNGAWGWHTLSGWTRPFTDGTRLDETLDSGTINLSNVTRSKAIKPFTRLRIIVSENNVEKERIYRLVASTQRKRKRYAGTPLYDWTINTIELTKLLERRLIDTMTVTKYLSTDYSNVSVTAEFVSGTKLESIESDSSRTIGTFNIPFEKGTAVTIPSTSSMFLLPSNYSGIAGTRSYSWSECKTQIKDENGNIIAEQTGNYGAPQYEYSFAYAGSYIVEYTIKILCVITAGGTITNQYYNAVYSYAISVANYNALPSQPTISSVCNRLLSAGTTRRKGVESQEFLLDPTFESEYANVPSPEFSFTNSTLFEALLQIGGYIHSIPRLVPIPNYDVRYYVTFDKLGGDEQAPTMPPFIYSESTIDVNDWCGQIDTPAQNLVNTEDVNAGSITELGNSFITVRTEDGQVEINADDVLIRVSKPIQQVVKVECVIGETNTNVGDITPYVYESAEYEALSSYWGTAYPYSKAWALYYTQGGNTIDGLTFRWETPTDTNKARSTYAIENIINAKIGTDFWIVDGEWMRKLAFRVTYVPIAQARVKAHKPSLAEGGAVNNALTYNQSANIAETSFYGEKMRGAIARLGHDVETRTYDIFHYDQLPKVGQLLDGKYIAHIDYEWDITKVRITVALTKDFNMLSQFVGLNSNYRLYDISEKQSVERNVNYDELVVVGDAPAVDMETYLMNKNVSQMMYYTFNKFFIPSLKDQKLKVAKLTPYDANSQEIPNRACILPAVAFPFGTSIALNVSYFDNYGAGYQQSNKYENEDDKAVQRLVPYTDSFGEIKYLKVTFDKETGWTQNSAADYDDNSPAMLYPQLITPDAGSNYVTTGDNYIDLQKDSREIINFTYQQHFVSTRPSIVLGSALAKYNPYVSIAETDRGVITDAYSILWLPTTINGLNKYIDATNATIVDETAIVPEPPAQGSSFTFDAGEAPINCASYAVCKKIRVDSQWKYELMFGENITLTQGQSAPTVTFAGALMQACNQDRPNCLKFIKNGTTRYTQAYTSGLIPVPIPLTLDVDGTYSGNDLSLGTTVYVVDRFIKGGSGQYHAFVQIPGQTTYYVKYDDIVTAYDFE